MNGEKSRNSLDETTKYNYYTLKGSKIISGRSNVSEHVEKVMFIWIDPSTRPSCNPNFTGSPSACFLISEHVHFLTANIITANILSANFLR
jgi:hypothetical protein